MKVLLFDPINGGHHDNYAIQLAQELFSAGDSVTFMGQRPLLTLLQKSLGEDQISVVEASGSASTSELNKIQLTLRVLATGEAFGADIIHFLYLDRHIMAMLPLLGRGNLAHVRATLHWAYFLKIFVPSRARQARGALEISLLKELTRRGLRILVHSRSIQAALNKILKRECVDYVPYPADPWMSKIDDPTKLRQKTRENLGIPLDVRLLLAFGGTRFDKGVDIAVEALAHLPENYHLLIAGKNESFERETLSEQSLHLGIFERVHVKLEHIPDDDVESIFLACDAAVLPYRKIFAGQSGPLTIAAALGVPVIAANVTVLQETVEEFGLGTTFAAESVTSLAGAIESYFSQPHCIDIEGFVAAHGVKRFADANRKSYALAYKITNS